MSLIPDQANETQHVIKILGKCLVSNISLQFFKDLIVTWHNVQQGQMKWLTQSSKELSLPCKQIKRMLKASKLIHQKNESVVCLKLELAPMRQ